MCVFGVWVCMSKHKCVYVVCGCVCQSASVCMWCVGVYVKAQVCVCGVSAVSLLKSGEELYWAIRRSWFARVNALCNLSCKKSQ